MRVLVTGSREWRDREMVFSALDTFHEVNGITAIIEGCARGADHFAEEWSRERLGKEPEHYPAPWDLCRSQGRPKAAGPIRNSQMLREGEPELVVAFHDDLAGAIGGGTSDMVHKARRANVQVVVVSHPASGGTLRVDDSPDDAP